MPSHNHDQLVLVNRQRARSEYRQLRKEYLSPTAQSRTRCAKLTQLTLLLNVHNYALSDTLVEIMKRRCSISKPWNHIEISCAHAGIHLDTVKKMLLELFSFRGDRPTKIRRLVLHDIRDLPLNCWLHGIASAEITSLKLSGVASLSIDDTHVFGRALISCCAFRLEIELGVLQSLTHLEAFSSYLAKSLHLKTLHLNRCHLEDAEVAVVAQAFLAERNTTPLEDLSIRGSYCKESATIAISKILTDPFISLKRLDLSHHYTWDNREYLRHLALALEHLNCHLEELTIAHAFVGDDFITHLMEALRSNKKSRLRKLCLDANSISNHGMMTLEGALPQLLNLKSLSMLSNKYSPCSVKRLEKALHNAMLLQDVQFDHISEAPLVQFYVLANRAGRRYQRASFRPLPIAVWPRILKRCQSKIFCRDLPTNFGVHDIVYEMVKGCLAVLQRY